MWLKTLFFFFCKCNVTKGHIQFLKKLKESSSVSCLWILLSGFTPGSLFYLLSGILKRTMHPHWPSWAQTWKKKKEFASKTHPNQFSGKLYSGLVVIKIIYLEPRIIAQGLRASFTSFFSPCAPPTKVAGVQVMCCFKYEKVLRPTYLKSSNFYFR